MPFGYRLEQPGQCHTTFDKNVLILIKVSLSNQISNKGVSVLCVFKHKYGLHCNFIWLELEELMMVVSATWIVASYPIMSLHGSNRFDLDTYSMWGLHDLSL